MPERLVHRLEDGDGLGFWCEGCQCGHRVWIVPGHGHLWTWNGDVDKPTLSPSVLCQGENYCCHLFVENGQIRYLPDCTHKLAGQTVPMEPL